MQQPATNKQQEQKKALATESTRPLAHFQSGKREKSEFAHRVQSLHFLKKKSHTRLDSAARPLKSQDKKFLRAHTHGSWLFKAGRLA